MHGRTQTVNRGGYSGGPYPRVRLLEAVRQDDCRGGAAETMETTGASGPSLQPEQSCMSKLLLNNALDSHYLIWIFFCVYVYVNFVDVGHL